MVAVLLEVTLLDGEEPVSQILGVDSEVLFQTALVEQVLGNPDERPEF